MVFHTFHLPGVYLVVYRFGFAHRDRVDVFQLTVRCTLNIAFRDRLTDLLGPVRYNINDLNCVFLAVRCTGNGGNDSNERGSALQDFVSMGLLALNGY